MDYIELQELIRNMKPRSKIYKFLKHELELQDRWKLKARGKNIHDIITHTNDY